MKKMVITARKNEVTTIIGSLLFSALLPKFDWRPLGGGRSGILDSRSGVNPFRIDDMLDLCSVFTQF